MDMAATQVGDGGGPAEVADSAQEFARERLRDAGKSMAPAELANEYGCSSGHMRNVLREMRKDGTVGRPEMGRYECPPGEDTEVDVDGVADVPAEPDDGAEDEGSGDGLRSASPDDDGISNRDRAMVGGATAGAAVAPTAIEKMSAGQLVVIGVALVAAYLIFVRGDDSSSSSGDADQQRDRGRPTEPSGVFG